MQKNIEILLIDDISTDSSLTILVRFEKQTTDYFLKI